MSESQRNANTSPAADENRRQVEFEIEFFRRVLARHPDHLDVLRRQARLLAGHGERREGLECDQRLVTALPHDPQVHYHLACSLAAVGRTDEAVQSLCDAVELGFRDFQHLESDPDLLELHEHPQYRALFRGVGEGTGD